MRLLVVTIIMFFGCRTTVLLKTSKRLGSSLTGSSFYSTVASWKWRQRDSLATGQILSGNIPKFLKKFTRINTSIEVNGKSVHAYYYVLPDYLSIGSDEDWARVPLTPMFAQIIADSFYCFLSTRKIADDIYKQAKVKLDPMPMFAFRDSSLTFLHHHLIIEGQRKGRGGLIAGIKKDVVLSDKVTRDKKVDRVAIYG